MVLLDLLHVQRAGFFKFLKIGIDKELSQLNINVDNTRLQIMPFFDTPSTRGIMDLAELSQKDRKQKRFIKKEIQPLTSFFDVRTNRRFVSSSCSTNRRFVTERVQKSLSFFESSFESKIQLQSPNLLKSFPSILSHPSLTSKFGCGKSCVVLSDKHAFNVRSKHSKAMYLWRNNRAKLPKDAELVRSYPTFAKIATAKIPEGTKEFLETIPLNQTSCFRLIASRYTPREAIIYQKSWSCRLVVKVLLTVHEKNELKKKNTSSYFVPTQNKQAPSTNLPSTLSNYLTYLTEGRSGRLQQPKPKERSSKFVKQLKNKIAEKKNIFLTCNLVSKVNKSTNYLLQSTGPTCLKLGQVVHSKRPLVPLEPKDPKAQLRMLCQDAKQQKTKQKSQKRNHELFLVLGELPLMTKRGHFIIHGSPRVILSQLIRTPGIYFTQKNNELQADCVPEQGPWLCIYKNLNNEDSTNKSTDHLLPSIEIKAPTVEPRTYGSKELPSVAASKGSIESRSTNSSADSSEVRTSYEISAPSNCSSLELRATKEPKSNLNPISFGSQHNNSKDLSFVDSLLYSNYRNESKIQQQASYFCYTKQFSSMPFSLVYSTFRVFELHSQFTDQTLLLTKLKTLEKIRKFKEVITTLLTFTWKKRVRRRLQRLYTKRCFTSTQQFEKTKLLFRLKKKLILGPLSRKSFNEKLGMSSCISTGVNHNAFNKDFFNTNFLNLSTKIKENEKQSSTQSSKDILSTSLVENQFVLKKMPKRMLCIEQIKVPAVATLASLSLDPLEAATYLTEGRSGSPLVAATYLTEGRSGNSKEGTHSLKGTTYLTKGRSGNYLDPLEAVHPKKELRLPSILPFLLPRPTFYAKGKPSIRALQRVPYLRSFNSSSSSVNAAPTSFDSFGTKESSAPLAFGRYAPLAFGSYAPYLTYLTEGRSGRSGFGCYASERKHITCCFVNNELNLPHTTLGMLSNNNSQFVDNKQTKKDGLVKSIGGMTYKTKFCFVPHPLVATTYLTEGRSGRSGNPLEGTTYQKTQRTQGTGNSLEQSTTEDRSVSPWLNSTTLLSRDLALIVSFLDGSKILTEDDIDDLNNQRIRTSSDQIQQQVRIGLFRFKKMFIKLISSGGTSQTITDFLNGALREFFGSNPLSQFLDQTNPLAEITHKRRISKLGLNGIQRESATLKVRTIHSTYFGRICPIETPEGINAGLVNSLTCLSRVDQKGQLVTPLSILIEGQKQEQFFYYSNKEDSPISTTDTALLKFHRLPNQFIYTKNESQFQQLEPKKVKIRVKSDLQTISLATALIPFLAYDDANRALMGSNMQRQAVPLILPERPIIRTGMESLVINESGHSFQSSSGGFISYVSAQYVVIVRDTLNKRLLI